MKFNHLVATGLAALALSVAPAANAIDTLIQFSTDATGTGADGSYDVTGVNEFDWQSSGDLVIEDVLPFAQACGAGICTTFSGWAAAAVNGDTIAFDAHVNTRLNDMLNNGGASVAPSTLSTDGGVTNVAGDTCANVGVDCFEVTGAVSFQETAVLSQPAPGVNILIFLSATGDYSYFYDTSPESNVATGGGYIDGTNFVDGMVACATTGCGTFTAGSGGSSFLANTVDSYDTTIIQTDPDSNAPLDDTTFDTLISLISTGEAAVGTGGTVGLTPYTKLLADLGLKADANSEFSAAPVPEPTTSALLALGLLGMAGLRRKMRHRS